MEIYGNNSEKLKKSNSGTVEINFDVYFLRKFTSNKQIFPVEKLLKKFLKNFSKFHFFFLNFIAKTVIRFSNLEPQREFHFACANLKNPSTRNSSPFYLFHSY